jgi:DNA polymerase III subunit epsilon
MSDAPSPRNRAEAIAWAREMASNPRAVFLDTETTGLGRGAEVVDLAVIDLSGVILANRLVRPLRPIPADAIFIHGISNRDVAESAHWAEIARDVRELLETRPIIAYNAPFDRSMIDQCNLEAGCDLVPGPWHCAMRAFTAFRRDCPDGPRSRGWHSLSTAARTFGFPAPSHRALADAQACRAVVLKMAEADDLF